MASLKNKENVQAKLKRLQKLARETAELSLEIFGDIIKRRPHPAPPRPKSGSGMVMMAVTTASDPIPPKPKLEALADIAHGALTIEESLPALDPEE